MTNIIPMIKPEPIERICAFCKKPEGSVKNMVSNNQDGPAMKSICGGCIELATARLAETEIPAPEEAV
jgi:hypothetical protein